MDSFHKDILKFGSLVGLKYFQFYLRGREELVVSIILQNPTTKADIKDSFLVTLYYKKAVPIVYALRDASTETGKAAEEQVEIQLSTVTNWKKKQVRLKHVLEDLLLACAKPHGVVIENPFAVDRDYFKTLCDKPEVIQRLFPRSAHIISCSEQVSLLAALTSGALLSVLDVTFLTEFHFNHSLLIGLKE